MRHKMELKMLYIHDVLLWPCYDFTTASTMGHSEPVRESSKVWSYHYMVNFLQIITIDTHKQQMLGCL